MKILVLGSLFILVSCSSTMLQSTKDRPKFAPKNYQQRGIVKYLNNGADSIIQKRREDAFEKMYNDCGGDYTVTFEGTATEGRSYNPNSFGGLTESGYNYMYLEYACNQLASN